MPADVPALSLTASSTDDTVLAATATVAIRHAVIFARLPALADIGDVTAALAHQHPRAVMWHGVKLAEIRSAIAGDELAVHATIYDCTVTPRAAAWEGTRMEVFCARPGSPLVRQVMLTPKGPHGTGSAQLYQNGSLQTAPPLRWTAESRAEGGYDLLALIPLSILQVDPAIPFLFETAIVATPHRMPPPRTSPCLAAPMPITTIASMPW